MILADLATGDAVFVDANTLSHLFQPHPLVGPLCQQLIQRIDRQDLVGFTSTHVVSEVSHRLMTVEANRVLGWSITGIGNRLRTNPHEVQKLSRFRKGLASRLEFRLQAVGVGKTASRRNANANGTP